MAVVLRALAVDDNNTGGRATDSPLISNDGRRYALVSRGRLRAPEQAEHHFGPGLAHAGPHLAEPAK